MATATPTNCDTEADLEDVTQVNIAHTTLGTNAHKNMSPGNPINEDMDVTISESSNQSHGPGDHHNNEVTTNEMLANTNMTTNEGNGEHCISNEDILGDENMDNPQNPNQGQLRSKIAKNEHKPIHFQKQVTHATM